MTDLPKVTKPRRFIDADYSRASVAVYAAMDEAAAAELSNMLRQAAQEQRRLVHLVAKGTARRKALRSLNAAYRALQAEYGRLHSELDTVRRQRDELYQVSRGEHPLHRSSALGTPSRPAWWWSRAR